MAEIPTLGELLEQSGHDFRVFDLGRRIQPLTPQLFRQFETGNAPYPYPLQRHAWLAVLGWQRDNSAEQFVWFVRFPLDETGHLQASARDAFLAGIVEELVSKKSGEEGSGFAANSPFGFKPKTDTMAVFHAQAARLLKQAPSKYYDHARDYLSGNLGWDQWAFVGLQGLADIAARLNDSDNGQRVAAAIPHLPAPAIIALCGCLEHGAINAAITDALAKRLTVELSGEAADPTLLAALLKGLAGSGDPTVTAEACRRLLALPIAHHIAILAAVAARLWPQLQEVSLARAFLNALAENSAGQDAFNQILADLLFIPGMRAPLLAELRSPERSKALEQAVGAMFGGNS